MYKKVIHVHEINQASRQKVSHQLPEGYKAAVKDVNLPWPEGGAVCLFLVHATVSCAMA